MGPLEDTRMARYRCEYMWNCLHDDNSLFQLLAGFKGHHRCEHELQCSGAGFRCHLLRRILRYQCT